MDKVFFSFLIEQ